jgi:hypothetical protein
MSTTLRGVGHHILMQWEMMGYDDKIKMLLE